MQPLEFGRLMALAVKTAAEYTHPYDAALEPARATLGLKATDNIADVGGHLTKLTPEYYPSPSLQWRQDNANSRANAFSRQATQAYYAAKNNKAQGKQMGLFATAAPLAGTVAGALTGQHALGTAGGAAGSLAGALGKMKAQKEQPQLDQRFQDEKALLESAAPPVRISGGGANTGTKSDVYPWNRK